MREFVWADGERTIHFGPAADAVASLGGPGYTLLTTPRAAAAAPWIVEAAGAVHEVGAGQVHELAGGLLGIVKGDRIVALGGGRVVDVAKALAAAANAGYGAGAAGTGADGGADTAEAGAGGAAEAGAGGAAEARAGGAAEAGAGGAAEAGAGGAAEAGAGGAAEARAGGAAEAGAGGYGAGTAETGGYGAGTAEADADSDPARRSATASRRAVRAMAVPTTLSGAEMTSGHRHAVGVEESVPRVRPAVVIFDPALAASQPAAELAASSLNALGHAVEGPCTVRANPVATLAAHEAARLIAAGWASDEPDRETLALGALLAGYVIDSTGLGLHHVLAQTLVREAGASHGPANAVVLPHTIAALARRKPAEIAALDAAASGSTETARHDDAETARGGGGETARSGGAETTRSGGAETVQSGGALVALARRLQTVAGAASLEAIGVDPAVLPACADAAAARPQLANTPPAADRDEILAIYEAAL